MPSGRTSSNAISAACSTPIALQIQSSSLPLIVSLPQENHENPLVINPGQMRQHAAVYFLFRHTVR